MSHGEYTTVIKHLLHFLSVRSAFEAAYSAMVASVACQPCYGLDPSKFSFSNSIEKLCTASWWLHNCYYSAISFGHYAVDSIRNTEQRNRKTLSLWLRMWHVLWGVGTMRWTTVAGNWTTRLRKWLPSTSLVTKVLPEFKPTAALSHILSTIRK